MLQTNFYSFEKKERDLSKFISLNNIKKFLHINEYNNHDNNLLNIFFNMAIEYAENFLNISIISNNIAIRYEIQINNLYKIFHGPYFQEIKIFALNLNNILDKDPIEIDDFKFIKPNLLEINTNKITKNSLIEINYIGHSINTYSNNNKYYPIYFNILKSTILNHIAYLYNNINNPQPNIPDSIVKTYNSLRKIYD